MIFYIFKIKKKSLINEDIFFLIFLIFQKDAQTKLMDSHFLNMFNNNIQCYNNNVAITFSLLFF